MQTGKWLSVFFCGICLSASAQNPQADSIYSVLKKAKHDTTIAACWVNLVEAVYGSTPDSVVPFSERALAIADRNIPNAKGRELWSYRQTKAAAYSNIGVMDQHKGNIPLAIEHFQLALTMYEAIDDKQGIALCMNNIAAMFLRQGQMEKSLEFFHKGLDIQEKIGDLKGKAQSLLNIGTIYNGAGDREKALENFKQALVINEKLGNKIGIANTLNNLGGNYGQMGQEEKALQCLKRGLEIQRELDDKKGMALTLQNMAALYLKKEDTHRAYEYYSEGLKLMEEVDYKIGTVISRIGLGKVLVFQKKYKEARPMVEQAGQTASDMGYVEGIKGTELLLARIDSADHNITGAYEHYKKFIFYRDSVTNVNTRKAGLKREMQYDYEKREAFLKSEQEKEIAVAEEKSRRQRLITYSLAGGLFFVVLLAGVIFRSLRVTRKQKQIIESKNKETEEQKRIIEEKNKDITDSITYAKRIQQAKLPAIAEVQAAFPQSFVLFKPKDIVSGDFYFFEKRKDKVFIAAADCTGHGVPGALMSMVGSEKLSDAVSQSSDTSEILKQLNKGLKASLRQSQSDTSTRDGMDIAFCSFDPKTNTLSYAGANRPLWLVRKAGSQLEEIKATKKAIGGLTDDDQHFESHSIQLQAGDTIYLTTDGYADLFNGKNGKKLMSKKFKEILLSIQDKSMPNQALYLETFAEEWKSGVEQVDDILVIGIRV